jgi:ribonuclease T2
LTTYDWLAGAGILPDASKIWTYDQLSTVIKAKYGFAPGIDCSSGEIFQISYYYRLIGSVIDGIWIPKDAPSKGSCPATGIKYLPKVYGQTPTTTSRTVTATGTTTTFTGTATPNSVRKL